MDNPFNSLEARLSNIENLLLDIKHEKKQPQPTEPEDKLLTVREAAEFLNLAVPTIYTNVAQGKLPSMKIGKKLYFSKKDLLHNLRTTRRKTAHELEQEAETYITQNK